VARGVVSGMVWSARRDLVVRALWTALVPGALLFSAMQTAVYLHAGYLGLDSHAYWNALQDPDSRYTLLPGYRDAYLYSPAFMQALWPLHWLPWRAFQVVWAAAQLAALFWLLRPLGWRRGLTLAPFFVTELIVGNVYLFFAVALVLMVSRFPGTVSLPILTKVVPGVVGLWFLVRREGRAAVVAAVTTVAITGLSVLLDPSGWQAWVHFLLDTQDARSGGTAWMRLVLSVALIAFAARTDRAWLLAPALILACPVLGGYGPLAVLAAIPRLLAWQREHGAARATAPAALEPSDVALPA